MKSRFEFVVSFVTAGLIAGGSALAGATTSIPHDVPLQSIGGLTWLTAIISGVIAAAHDARSYLTEHKHDGEDDEDDHQE